MVSDSRTTKDVVCVVGLGYVGLPLAEQFVKHFRVIGFDIDREKIHRLASKISGIEFTSDPSRIRDANFVIIAVPTPVTSSKEPDLSLVCSATTIVAKHMKQHAIVVLESTVYPGVTEELVLPLLERESGRKAGVDFAVGYSPERVNPGDRDHTIEHITKIVSGMNEESTKRLAELYNNITNVYIAPDIKTAEAAKVIENIQRDLNIALMNELSIIFYKLGLDTKAILDAASTKWNFHRYEPGMVGGHCIPVDPFYLVYKAKQIGYHPQVILAGRAINDYEPRHVALMAIKGLNRVGKVINGSKLLIMGLTYKENVPDVRESPVSTMIEELREFNVDIYGYDPLLSKKEIEAFGIPKYSPDSGIMMDCLIVTVAHKEFTQMSLVDLKRFSTEKTVLVDVRRIFEKKNSQDLDFLYITL
jgi:UDP-N-acetyl-D-galactosamine dehydrogenase